MNYSGSDLTRGYSALYWLLLICLLALVSLPVKAARVADLYEAIVTLPAAGAEPLEAAFDVALGEVLVKVTGLPEAGNREVWVSLFPNSASVVQQYSLQSGQLVQVKFDQKALQRVLDHSGFPVWGVDRPLVAVWVAVDEGGGRRQIIAEDNDLNEGVEEMRTALTAVAAARGLPVVFPLVDAEDLAQVSFADIWGDFRQPVMAASMRYAAEAVLIGRSRSFNLEQAGVRWTLVIGDETVAWQGDVDSGPGEAAVFLSQRLATFADSAGALRVLVKNVSTLDHYGQLLKYFRSLSIVDEAGVSRLSGNDVEFRIVARGDVKRLASELAGSRLLEVYKELPGANEFARAPDLVYSWRQAGQGGR